MLFFKLSAAVMASLLLASCSPSPGSPDSVGKTSSCVPVYYGQNVYYFPCTEAAFANALASFKLDRPELVVSAMTGNGTGLHGYDKGYFVSAELRPASADASKVR